MPLDRSGPLPAAEASGNPTASGPLAEIDSIVANVALKNREAAESSARTADEREEFSSGFRTACQTELRPAMQAVLERLQAAGGGGVIEEHPGGEPRFPAPRLTLWMSLAGEIAGAPRVDRCPYLEIEADVAKRRAQVSEGDMWRGGGGGRSGRVAEWQLPELTYEHVVQELLSIARRAAA
jgi:hypothetical protein